MIAKTLLDVHIWVVEAWRRFVLDRNVYFSTSLFCPVSWSPTYFRLWVCDFEYFLIVCARIYSVLLSGHLRLLLCWNGYVNNTYVFTTILYWHNQQYTAYKSITFEINERFRSTKQFLIIMLKWIVRRNIPKVKFPSFLSSTVELYSQLRSSWRAI